MSSSYSSESNHGKNRHYKEHYQRSRLVDDKSDESESPRSSRRANDKVKYSSRSSSYKYENTRTVLYESKDRSRHRGNNDKRYTNERSRHNEDSKHISNKGHSNFDNYNSSTRRVHKKDRSRIQSPEIAHSINRVSSRRISSPYEENEERKIKSRRYSPDVAVDSKRYKDKNRQDVKHDYHYSRSQRESDDGHPRERRRRDESADLSSSRERDVYDRNNRITIAVSSTWNRKRRLSSPSTRDNRNRYSVDDHVDKLSSNRRVVDRDKSREDDDYYRSRPDYHHRRDDRYRRDDNDDRIEHRRDDVHGARHYYRDHPRDGIRLCTDDREISYRSKKLTIDDEDDILLETIRRRRLELYETESILDNRRLLLDNDLLLRHHRLFLERNNQSSSAVSLIDDNRNHNFYNGVLNDSDLRHRIVLNDNNGNITINNNANNNMNNNLDDVTMTAVCNRPNLVAYRDYYLRGADLAPRSVNPLPPLELPSMIDNCNNSNSITISNNNTTTMTEDDHLTNVVRNNRYYVDKTVIGRNWRDYRRFNNSNNNGVNNNNKINNNRNNNEENGRNKKKRFRNNKGITKIQWFVPEQGSNKNNAETTSAENITEQFSKTYQDFEDSSVSSSRLNKEDATAMSQSGLSDISDIDDGGINAHAKAKHSGIIEWTSSQTSVECDAESQETNNDSEITKITSEETSLSDKLNRQSENILDEDTIEEDINEYSVIDELTVDLQKDDDDDDKQSVDENDSEDETDLFTVSKVSDMLGIDWECLVAESSQTTTSSTDALTNVRERWAVNSILDRIGLSLKYAGPRLFEELRTEMINESSDNDDTNATNGCYYPLSHPVAGIHARSNERAHEQSTLLVSSKKAITLRRDIALRRQLNNLPVKDIDLQQSVGLCSWIV